MKKKIGRPKGSKGKNVTKVKFANGMISAAIEALFVGNDALGKLNRIKAIIDA